MSAVKDRGVSCSVGGRIKPQAWIHLLNGAGYRTQRYQSDHRMKFKLIQCGFWAALCNPSNPALIYWPNIGSYGLSWCTATVAVSASILLTPSLFVHYWRSVCSIYFSWSVFKERIKEGLWYRLHCCTKKAHDETVDYTCGDTRALQNKQITLNQFSTGSFVQISALYPFLNQDSK